MSPKNPRSIYRNYFKILKTERSDSKGPDIAECTFCSASFVCYNTSNLVKHLRRKHHEETAFLWEDDDDVKQGATISDC